MSGSRNLLGNTFKSWELRTKIVSNLKFVYMKSVHESSLLSMIFDEKTLQCIFDLKAKLILGPTNANFLDKTFLKKSADI